MRNFENERNAAFAKSQSDEEIRRRLSEGGCEKCCETEYPDINEIGEMLCFAEMANRFEEAKRRKVRNRIFAVGSAFAVFAGIVIFIFAKKSRNEKKGKSSFFEKWEGSRNG